MENKKVKCQVKCHRYLFYRTLNLQKRCRQGIIIVGFRTLSSVEIIVPPENVPISINYANSILQICTNTDESKSIPKKQSLKVV